VAPTRTPLRIGLIGCGLRGGFHSRAIRAIARRELLDIEYAAVCDFDEARARSFAEAAGVPRVTTEPADVLGDPDLNVVYITVPTASHKDLVRRAAANGKHVFCEKPLATNLADVEAMVKAVDDAGIKAGVGLVLRHSPVLTVMKSFTEDGSLGRLMAIIFRDDQFFPVQGHYNSDWRADRKVVGSGTLLEHSIHDVDLLRWLGGDIARVRGATRNFAGYEGIEDLASASFEFESGALAELTSIWHSVLGRPSTRRIELFFEKGVLFTDHDFLGPIYTQTHALNPEVIPEDEVRRRYLAATGYSGTDVEDLLRYTFEDYLFLKALADGAQPFPDFHVALEAHRVVDAVYRSAEQGGATLEIPRS
jgi:predicted dehydrogenase